MQNAASSALIVLGGLLLLGLATEFLGRATSLPRVTLLLLFGILLGPEVLGLLPSAMDGWFSLITDIALLLVGFLLGGRLSLKRFSENGIEVLCLSISVVICTVLFVALGLWFMGFPLAIALLLGGIATATDPAATVDVVRERGARGHFTDTLQDIVAIDDAWGLVVFSVLLATVQLMQGTGEPLQHLWRLVYELGGSVVLGIAMGIPMAFLTGRIRPGEPTLVEALGIVFLCGGLADLLGVSFLLTAMVLGATVSNLARHHERPFHEIEDIEWPFMILFFVLTGASLTFDHLGEVTLLALAYIALRATGRALGSWPGGIIAGSVPTTRRWMGVALLPQAGVAAGMALLASNAFPQWRDSLLSVTILATVVFELIGPVMTRISLQRVGEG